MKVDGILPLDLEGVAARATELERTGFDAGLAAEVSNDPFLPLALAAEHTERLRLMTSVAVAFARSPMTVAQLGFDLNGYSRGRFILGLGSQVRAHVVRRFGMPWSKPAARMREFVLAMRAIWDAWTFDAKLDFRGEFYSHTLMTPMFRPGNVSFGPPKVMIAGVNPRMTEVAGEVADGFVAHGFTTARYLREVTLPAIERGLARGGRRRRDFEVCCPVFVVTGRDDAEVEASRSMAKSQLAFYGSTPSYRPVLELHGWNDLADELHRLSREGRWAEMGDRVSDDVLEAFAVVAAPGHLADALRARCDGLVDRLAFTAMLGPETTAEVVRDLHGPG
ncbi:TIGR03617 family F420-dependent LLM class oxidoreductase [bacterium]|nr:TIGR03617 family F420-dependent LLM class oxidoreductase [bacterium]